MDYIITKSELEYLRSSFGANPLGQQALALLDSVERRPVDAAGFPGQTTPPGVAPDENLAAVQQLGTEAAHKAQTLAAEVAAIPGVDAETVGEVQRQADAAEGAKQAALASTNADEAAANASAAQAAASTAEQIVTAAQTSTAAPEPAVQLAAVDAPAVEAAPPAPTIAAPASDQVAVTAVPLPPGEPTYRMTEAELAQLRDIMNAAQLHDYVQQPLDDISSRGIAEAA